MSTMSRYRSRQKMHAKAEEARALHRTEANLRSDLLQFDGRCSLCNRTMQHTDEGADDYACLVRKFNRLFCRRCTTITAKLSQLELSAKGGPTCC